MKIVVTGTRGIPDIQGGVETHCEELYPRIAAMGHDVTVVRRDCYVNEQQPLSEYRGVHLKDIATPRRKSLEAIIHTWRALRYARSQRPDVLHIHAIGPSLMAPVARMMGMKVVTTNHGPDYDRAKWGRMAKAVLRLGEKMGARYSDQVIVISKVIAGILADKYGRKDTNLIYNGVAAHDRSLTPVQREYLASLGLEPGNYVVALGRFVPEKNFDQLIKAFNMADRGTTRLVIAGDADHADAYSESLKKMAHDNGAVLTGFIKGDRLDAVMSGARLFVLPSSHEGLPISLLEAMSYGIDVLCSDIAANRIYPLCEQDFFSVGNVADMAEALSRKLADNATPRSYDLAPYDWDHIARQTVEVYRKAADIH